MCFVYFQESQFCLMTEAFITKLDAACKRATSITCPSLLRVCQQKLNSILQPGGADGYRCLKLNLHVRIAKPSVYKKNKKMVFYCGFNYNQAIAVFSNWTNHGSVTSYIFWCS